MGMRTGGSATSATLRQLPSASTTSPSAAPTGRIWPYLILAHPTVAASIAPKDCGQLPSEFVVAYAGHWHSGSAFPQNEKQLVVVERVGTQTRQRLYYHWPKGQLTESFSWIIDDTATPGVKRSVTVVRGGDELATENGMFHWNAEAAKYDPGQKMSRSTRKSF